MKQEDRKKKQEKAILEELQLLEKMRKEHEWATFEQKEAEEEEKIEAELDTEASETPDKPETK